MDKLAAFSLAQGPGTGQSLARVRFNQIQALLKTFKVSNKGSDYVEDDGDERKKKLFANIIKRRL